MSSAYWLIPIVIGSLFLLWVIRDSAKHFLVFATFSKPDLFSHFPYLYDKASRRLVEHPDGYIERHPIRIVHTLQTLASGPDLKMRDQAMRAIVDNIGSVAEFDEGAAAAALLTVINESEVSSLTHGQAMLIRPGIIDKLAKTDPVQAVLLAQRGVTMEGEGEDVNNQSCALVMKHLGQAFRAEPVVAPPPVVYAAPPPPAARVLPSPRSVLAVLSCYCDGADLSRHLLPLLRNHVLVPSSL